MIETVIMRGPPGCGKSTRVQEILDNNFGNGIETHVLSADHFFMTDEGVYEFDSSKLAEAHQWCYGRFLRRLAIGSGVLVIDNTNIHRWECKNYELATHVMGGKVTIEQFVPKYIGDIKLCCKRNVHGVPDDIIRKMCVEFEPSHEDSTVQVIEHEIR